ncbi:MAG: DUF1499 domain-containing protein [Deltaproteobacteria bacterium]|nr:DUF1499 domain-containing protein [Deltaproteobacteria bacterium]
MSYLMVAAALALSLNVADCPDSPNCVSSQASAPGHRVEPFSYAGWSREAAQRALLAALATLPRTAVVADQAAQVKATATSALFGFVDDLDFVFDDENHVIQVRSASRTGYWDLGVNARRIEDLREAFQQALAQEKPPAPPANR